MLYYLHIPVKINITWHKCCVGFKTYFAVVALINDHLKRPTTWPISPSPPPTRCYEQWAERAYGFPGPRSLRAGSGRWGDGLQGLGATQLPGAGQLQPPLSAGPVLEKTLLEPGQAEGLQQDVCAALWLRNGQSYSPFWPASVQHSLLFLMSHPMDSF